MKLITLLAAVFFACACTKHSEYNSAMVNSPDGKTQVRFAINEQGEPGYQILKDNKTLIEKSRLGFILGKGDFSRDFKIIESKQCSFDETWEPVVGQFKSIRNHYNELWLKLQEKSAQKRTLEIVFRVFDDGVGFRYKIPKQENISAIEILSEETEFNFVEDNTAWWIPGDYNSYENIYNKTLVSQIDSANTPVSFKTSDGLYMSIHEANLTDYSDMTLKNRNGGKVLECELVPWPDGVKVKGKTPFVSPWRTIQIAEDAGGLIESSLVLNLNEANKIEDTSWIKPMKYTGIWWSVHLGYETFEIGPHHAGTTEKTKEMIDFASESGLKGVLVEGWNKGWDKRGRSDEIPDYLNGTDDYNLEYLVDYAKSKGVEMIIHHETFGNIAHYEKYLEPSFKMIRDLGLSSVKGGYAGSINPSDQFKHGQFMVRHYRKQLELAAKYGIMLDIHEPIKQTGLRRTYPNFMTTEGVRGMEFAAWSDGNPPSHTVTIPFTRMLAGPVDYNAGIFDIKYKSLDEKEFNWRKPKKHYPRNPGPCVKTTLAKQLALHVVLFSPMQMSPDLPENYRGHPAFKFLQDVDVVWDDTKVLNGEIGEFITIARKGKDSENWYIGSMTNEKPRNLNISLDFLDANKTYKATIYADGNQAHWDENPTDYVISEKEVNCKTPLEIKLASGGGQAISIVPIK